MNKKQIILVWPSGSWKSSLMERLIENDGNTFCRPIQFTTRKPRSDSELDSYVFLTKEQFFKKLDNWDFLEFTQYNWEYYAISKYIDLNKVNIFIVEPVGRTSLEKYFKQNSIQFASFFVSITKEEAKNRMMDRWDSLKKIEERLSDFLYFRQLGSDIVLDWTNSLHHNEWVITRYFKWHS